MMRLYVLDKPLAGIGLSLAGRDPLAAVVLIQDGVYLDCRPLHAAGHRIYALKRDVEMRGLARRLPDFVTPIDYGQWLELIVENRVVNFA